MDRDSLVERTGFELAGPLICRSRRATKLIVGNLMDLTHIQFLDSTLSTPDWIEKCESEVMQSPGVVQCTNWAKNVTIFPIDRMIKPTRCRLASSGSVSAGQRRRTFFSTQRLAYASATYSALTVPKHLSTESRLRFS